MEFGRVVSQFSSPLVALCALMSLGAAPAMAREPHDHSSSAQGQRNSPDALIQGVREFSAFSGQNP
jgi:hypothetical protein